MIFRASEPKSDLIMVLALEPLSDEELVARPRSQPESPEAERWLNELFQRHQRRVALWCLRITGNRESAADLAQEVLLRAFRSLESYRGDSKFSTWLYSITRNHCFSEIKSPSNAPEEVVDLKLENPSGAKAYVVSARRKLQRAVDRWKAREQRAPT